MKRILMSRTAIIGTGALSMLFFVIALYASSSPLSYYWDVLFSVFAEYRPAGIGVFIYASGAAVCFLLFNIGILLNSGRLKDSRIHRFDFYYAVITIVTLFVPLIVVLIHERRDVFMHPLLIVISLSLILYLWSTSIIRIRAGTLRRTIYWFRVFRTLPLRKTIGLFLFAVVVASTFFVFYNAAGMFVSAVRHVFSIDMGIYDWLFVFAINIGIPAFITCLTGVLCRDIVRLTEAKEKAAAARGAAENFRVELIANVTHDIRTPLTSIINYVDLLGNLPIEDEKFSEYVSILEKKSARLKSLINDLLDASKASSGNIPVHIEEIDLPELLGQIAGDFDEMFEARDLTYVNSIEDRNVVVLSDGAHLWRVLENLYSNVVKYAMQGTRVYLSMEESESCVVLRIKNISERELNITPDELMRQFVRGDESRTSEGNGLGLFIADRLTELMGANLALSINGDLFVATLTLPRK